MSEFRDRARVRISDTGSGIFLCGGRVAENAVRGARPRTAQKTENAPIRGALSANKNKIIIRRYGGHKDKTSQQKPCVPQVNNLYRKEEGRGQNNKTLPLWCQLAIKIATAKIRVEAYLVIAFLVVIVLSH